MTTIRTTCPNCGDGCGVLATPDGKGGLTIAGDPDHPANFGRLCSKRSALGETLGLGGRLLTPRIDGVEAGWDSALDLAASRFRQAIADHGPNSVAFYVLGQMLTEDYYVANKLMKGFIGSANIDTNSRLCMASSVAAHRRAFGSDTVPGLYDDLEQADLVVLTGSNLAWCHPVLYQRLATAKSARSTLRVVVIDPRRTATCDLADLHLAIAPGGDSALFAALLVAIDDRGATVTAPICTTSAAMPRRWPPPARRTRRQPACPTPICGSSWPCGSAIARWSRSIPRASTGPNPAPIPSTPSSIATLPQAASVAPAWDRSA